MNESMALDVFASTGNQDYLFIYLFIYSTVNRIAIAFLEQKKKKGFLHCYIAI